MRPVSEFANSELDPGIREVVRLVQAAGFMTTDSGDGVSKPADWYETGEALPYPHVVVKSTPQRMVTDAHNLVDLLNMPRPGARGGWVVQATYTTNDRSCLLLASQDAIPYAAEAQS